MSDLKPNPFRLFGIPVKWEGKLNRLQRLLLKLNLWYIQKKYDSIWDYLEQTGQSL